jgi:antirestriction protein ArdC
LDLLHEDNRAIIRAASHPSKAADYILGFLPDNRHPDDNGKPSDEQRAA